MTILSAIRAAERYQRDANALTRLVSDAQRDMAKLQAQIDLPTVSRIQEQVVQAQRDTARLLGQIDFTAIRRAQEQVAMIMGEPAKDLHERLFGAVTPTSRLMAAVLDSHDQRRILEQLGLTSSETWSRMSEVSKAIGASSKLVQEQLSAITAPFEDLRAFVGHFDSAWLRSAQQIAQAASQAYQRIDRHLAGVLKRRGWLGVERHLEVTEMKRLLDLKSSETDKFVCTAFRRNRFSRITRMTKTWWNVPYLCKRRPVIRQAIRAHKRGEYALSIAALLPLTDGLAAQIRRSNPKLATVKGKSGKIVVREVVALYQSKGRVREWAEAAVAAVCERMFKDYDFDNDPVPAKVNRHGVLHGRIHDYPSEANSLRVILLLDVLAHIASGKP